MSNRPSSFKELSAILVGEAEVALSTADRHLATLTVHFGESAVQDLLTRFEDLKAVSGDLNDSIANQIISDPALGPIARSMLFLWFAGLLDLAATPFPQATGANFAEALMWTAAGAHPAGYSDGYYGHWRYPPDAGI